MQIYLIGKHAWLDYETEHKASECNTHSEEQRENSAINEK
jgi:hypothetical protein